MEATQAAYDPRYLAGVLFFNHGDYFEAHEVWELVWMEADGVERRFYQGLIQAAVGLLHFGNGNLRGAVKLFHSSRDYMREIDGRFLGLDVSEFWKEMGRCFEPLLIEGTLPKEVELHMDMVPVIELDPPPEPWPDPSTYVEDE
jgi:hypothetical protein